MCKSDAEQSNEDVDNHFLPEAEGAELYDHFDDPTIMDPKHLVEISNKYPLGFPTVQPASSPTEPDDREVSPPPLFESQPLSTDDAANFDLGFPLSQTPTQSQADSEATLGPDGEAGYDHVIRLGDKLLSMLETNAISER